MGNKAFIARDESGLCFIMSEKPVFKDGKFISSGGLTADFHPTVAALLGIPFPAPGKMIEWPMPAQTAAPEPEPPAETLVPITDLSQLKVGDKVRTATGERTVLALVGCIVGLSRENEPDIPSALWTLKLIKERGYQQVVTAPRPLNRDEARKAIERGKTVWLIGGEVEYQLANLKSYIVAGVGGKELYRAYKYAFYIPEGRYEIVTVSDDRYL